MAKKPQIRFPSVNTVGKTATVRILIHGSDASGQAEPQGPSIAGQNRAAAADFVADLGQDLQPGLGGKDQFGARAQLDHTEFVAACDQLAAPQVAHDPPGNQPGNLPHDEPPIGRALLLQPNPQVFVADRTFGVHGIEELRPASNASESPAIRRAPG